MGLAESTTQQLLDRAGRGDAPARQQLLQRHRDRLRQMVRVRMDRRLMARVDPSDVVQEALVTAAQHLSDYLRDRPLPFYPWLRRLAWERLIELHRHHLQAQRRSVAREEGGRLGLNDDSVNDLADRLMASGTSPSRGAIRQELRERVRAALDRLDERDREVLVLRYLEQLSTGETAAILELSESGVKSRLMRALARLRGLLDAGGEEVSP